jgi:hypothetical protein
MSGIRTVTRSVLSRRLAVADVIELGLWLAIPYVTIGLAWAFFHAAEVRHIENLLQTHVPAGGGMAAYLLFAAFWPVHVLVPTVCVV